MRDRESLARPVPLTTDGESLLPLGGGGGPRSKALALANAGIEFSTPGGRSYHAKTWLISRVIVLVLLYSFNTFRHLRGLVPQRIEDA